MGRVHVRAVWRKMEKKIVLVGVLVILLVGGVSAGLLDFFGVISGEVVVTGPVFYLDDDKLLLNEIPDSEETIVLVPNSEVILLSDSLGVDELYEAEFNMKIWIKAHNSGDKVLLTIINEDSEIICGPEEFIITAHIGSFRKREIGCLSSGVIDLMGKDKIGLEISGDVANVGDIEIIMGKKYTDGYSRMEVSKV